MNLTGAKTPTRYSNCTIHKRMDKVGRSLLVLLSLLAVSCDAARHTQREVPVMESRETVANLHRHLAALTVEIGERSVRRPEQLQRTADYIESFYHRLGLAVERETYRYQTVPMANMVAEIAFSKTPAKRYLLGAHYDSVAGTVGADDNASAIAVQLEVARQLHLLHATEALDLAVKLVSFALEERPAYATRSMGSRVHARQARLRNEHLDGMLCLEMVGYTCSQPGCQSYPLPWFFANYPQQGDFIGIVGNFHSRGLTRALYRSFQKNPRLPAVKLTVPLSGWLLPPVRLSDHASFWDQGFKAVMITDTAFYRNPYYHTAADTMDRLDYQFMAELVNSLVAFFRSHRR